MTSKEAIDQLILNEVWFKIEQINEHEEWAEDEQGEYQLRSYEENKKSLDAYIALFSSIDPELSSKEAIWKRYEELDEKECGETSEKREVGEVEKELFELLNPWYKEAEKANGGFATSFTLSDEENYILAKINLEEGNPRKVVGMDEEDDDEELEPSEDDTFSFYPYRGEVFVEYNDYSDGNFSSYPEAFQKKALEIIKNKINKREE